MIRRLTEDDLEPVIVLRREALIDAPHAFFTSPSEDVGSDPASLRRVLSGSSEQAIFGAWDGWLVGILGVYRQRRLKERHKAQLGRMYVHPAFRHRGHGAALLREAIAFARTMPGVTHLHLSVSETAQAAKRLYQRAGFVTWGAEPAGLVVAGVPVTSFHMVLLLTPEGSQGGGE